MSPSATPRPRAFFSHSKAKTLAAVVLLALFGISLAGGVVAAAEPATSPAPERARIEGIVHDYLMRHPEVVVDAIKAYQVQAEVARQNQQKAALVSLRPALVSSPHSPVAGNPEGDVTVVEFFDYQCPYCKRATQSLMDLMADDPKVRVVFKEFPILGPASLIAAKTALAAAKQSSTAYLKLHQALMEHRGPLSERAIDDLAASAGLDRARLARDRESADILAEIDANRQLAQNLGITGTPAFVIGDELAPGALDKTALDRLVAQARAN